MRPSLLRDHNVRARCPDCNAVTTFELGDNRKHPPTFGSIDIQQGHSYNGIACNYLYYFLLRCAGCSRAGVAKVHQTQSNQYFLEWFFPNSIDQAVIPGEVPEGIKSEFREAELCASSGALRAASAMLRSTLEKTLRANGYIEGSLYRRIELAAEDGVITEQRRRRAHDEIRVLGNDVLHEDWRGVSEDEVELAHHYVQRILEDFYDDRNTVVDLLLRAGRIANETIAEESRPQQQAGF